VVVEDYVTCTEFDDALGMSGCIVEQVNAGMGGGFSGAGLLRRNGAEGHGHGVVEGRRHSRGTRPQSLRSEWRRQHPEEGRCQEWSFEPWLNAGEAHVCGGCQRGLDQCGQNVLELGQHSRAWRV